MSLEIVILSGDGSGPEIMGPALGRTFDLIKKAVPEQGPLRDGKALLCWFC
jgi:hypothetical protein